MLFSKVRARIYFLQRTCIKRLPTQGQVTIQCRDAKVALDGHASARRKKYEGVTNWAEGKPTLFVEKLKGEIISSLPWDNKKGSWSHQWKMSRPPMVIWKK